MPYLKLLHAKDPQVHVLSRDVTTLGRSGEADIAIGGDRGVSKLHARIETEASGFVIADLGSRNGTYVNDHPISGKPAPLLPGDRIRLGRSVFVFEEGEPEGTVPEKRTDDLQAPASLFRADQLPYTMAGGTPAVRPEDTDGRLLKLTELSKEVMTARSEAELSALVTRSLLEWMEADCCAIVHPMETGEGYDFEIQTLASRPGFEDRSISISTTAVKQALENRMASITSNALGDERFRDRQSVIVRRLVSILCVPLWHEDRVFGLLYLDSADPAVEFTVDHLGLSSAVANLTAIKTDNLRLFDAAVAKSALDKELALAGEIQAGLLPGESYAFNTLACAGTHVSCEEIGGDYYDFIPYGEDVLTVTIADVTGHGPSSALLMVACKTMLTTLIDIGVPLVERVGRLNEYILHHSSVSQFITFFHADIDTRTNTLRYCNAGHNPPMLLSQDGPVQKLHSVAPPLGIADVSFELESVRFEPGTRLVMYTDGVTEAANADGELYEEQRLESLLTKHRGQDAGALKDTVMAAVFGFSAGSRQCDDVTLAVVEHTGA
ncbi:MAG: SpoIIE family protein phosphatase [Gemmatimonadetes bacterium]|nr:SpoIIE family protein phosphatase [Gemmatimonadota bacterium]